MLPAAVAIVLLARVLTLGVYPLTDTTEARYAEIARKMVQLNDWVTPWYEYGTPFWAKPPLSMWMTAGSFKLLGFSEFAARLPHLLAGCAIVWLLWDWLRSAGARQAWLAATLLSGGLVFYVSAGAVMTDTAMVLGTTLAMRGMWLGMNGEPRIRRREAILAFLGISLGLLAKGPVALVLVLMAAGAWALSARKVAVMWRELPWLRGALLTMALTIPWYAAAELATPGFLRYFLIGEHWQRFLVSGWAGDRFGNAHAFPRGSILLFAVMAFLPWTVLLPPLAWRQRRLTRVAPDGLAAYLGWFAFVPILFSLPAGNILWTYVLPAAPAFAAWGALWLSTLSRRRLVDGVVAAGAIAMSLAFTGVVTYRNLTNEWKSAKDVVTAYRQYATQAPAPLLFLGGVPYSASFYSQGQAQLISGTRELQGQESPAYLAVAATDFYSLDFEPPTGWRLLGRHDGYVLLYHAPD